MRSPCSQLVLAALAISLAAALAPSAGAQDIEPRTYSNAPVGLNFLIAGVIFTRGGVVFDTIPVTVASIDTWSPVLGYARVLDIGGKSAKFDIVVPGAFLDGQAVYQGRPVERVVDGFADPRFRLSVNLLGAPALRATDFRAYEQDWILGLSLQVGAPWGQYDPTRLVNIGTNRWSFKPELGVSKAVGPWTFEGQLAATFTTDNDDFYGGNERSQDVMYTVQTHAIRGFKRGSWATLDIAYLTGGRTTLNGQRNADLQENWRVGTTIAVPLAKQQSLKLNVSSGVSSRRGNAYDLVGVAWQYRWGGGR